MVAKIRVLQNTEYGGTYTGISSQIRTKLRDWAIGQARAGCYSQAAMSSNDSKTLYRAAQNHGEQVLRMSCIQFHLLTFQFVVIPHGKRDLSSLPEVGEAAVQIS